MNTIPYKTYLEENEVPECWYNMRADMKKKPAPLLIPATGKPCTAEDLAPVFCEVGLVGYGVHGLFLISCRRGIIA